MPERRIRVLSVDDHAFIAEGLRTRFGLERDLDFVGWLPSADKLLKTINELKPDVVLLDIDMPGADPFDVLEDVKSAHPDIRVILLSAFVRDRYLDLAVDRGAWGYLSKGDSPDDVVDAIRKAMREEFVLGPQVVERCQNAKGQEGEPRPASRLELLSQRELQILRMIGKGMTRHEIAQAVHRSAKTIDNHRAAIMEKLGIRDRVELARFAIREGLSDPD